MKWISCRGRLAAAALLASTSTLVLTACGGSDADSGSDDARATVQSTAEEADVARVAEPPFHLFLPDLSRTTVAAVSSAQPDAGATLSTLQIRGKASTGNDLQLDRARDELYAIASGHVDVYAGASTLTGASVPSRSFALPPSLTRPHTLFLDIANDVLYVGGDAADGSGEIAVYDFAHTVTGTSASMVPAPTRVMFVDDGVAFFTLDVRRGRLYVVNAQAGVRVYADAGAAAGVLSPVMTIPVLGTGLAVDEVHDRLYVADPFAGLLLIDQASTASPVLTTTISIDNAAYVGVDSEADRVYVTAGPELYVLEGASALAAGATLAAPVVSALATSSFGSPAWR